MVSGVERALEIAQYIDRRLRYLPLPGRMLRHRRMGLQVRQNIPAVYFQPMLVQTDHRQPNELTGFIEQQRVFHYTTSPKTGVNPGVSPRSGLANVRSRHRETLI
ncbi:hypothetical protein MA13_contig00013-0040 [Edwardsiella piscicida]|nr:hypothetical protein MA13_contig00013-0040 [Edwardsiella piscicida]